MNIVCVCVCVFAGRCLSYLDLDWPGEVADIDIEGGVGVEAEVEFLTGETVSVFLNVGPGHNVHLFT